MRPIPMEVATTRGEEATASVALDLEHHDDLHVLQAEGWRIAPGLVPGEPNQGLVAERRGRPPRLADFDDAGWAVGAIQERRSLGFTFAWYRLRCTRPAMVKGQAVAGNRGFFECNVDNDGEVWGDGVIDRTSGAVTGNNTPKRGPVQAAAGPGATHVSAVLAANAPLGDPVGAMFFRYATLAFEAAAGEPGHPFPAYRDWTPSVR